MTIAAVILAAGRGTRMGGGLPKQWQMLGGQPVVTRSLAAFAALPEIAHSVLVIHPGDRPLAQAHAPGTLLVEGGATRAASVRAALQALTGTGTSRVLIHDGARPLVSSALIRRLIAALDGHAGAAPALPVSDALWRGAGGLVTGTAPRDGLYRAQTPQAFRFDAILAAHMAHGADAADDVEVARAALLDVAIVEGDEDNLKLTFPGDFARAETILAARLAGGR